MNAAYLLVPAAIAWVVIALLRATPLAARLGDRPNERSLHERPTPRLGGLGIVAGVAACTPWLDFPANALLACAGALAAVSLLDDFRSLPIEVRLPSHLAAAAVAVAVASSATSQTLPWALMAFAVLVVVWMTNLFNFMDGADGLAGGMAAIGFGTLAIAATFATREPLAWTCAAVAAASVGFLLHNWPPARVFMGDAGSIPLGFLSAALGMWGWLGGAWPVWFAPLVFSPFIVDATLTLARRAIAGERFWRAHREHYYQRLVLGGWSKRRLASSAYALMLALSASALVARAQGFEVRCAIILAWAILYGLLLRAIDRRTPRRGGASDARLPDAGSGKE